MEEIILYNYFRSSTSYRVRIALHWKNISFKYEPVHLLKDGGEQHKTDYHQLNPMEEVPTLVHKGPGFERTLAQSLPIMEYLDEVFPSRPLLPKDAFKRAKVRQFCENINSFIHPLGNLKVLQYLEAQHGYDTAKKNAWVQHWADKGLLALENMITEAKGQYALGDEITMADICLAPQIFSAHRFKVDLKAFPRILQLEQKYQSLEAFEKAHPLKQIDTPPEEKK